MVILESKRLVKIYGGQPAIAGNIIVGRQRGNCLPSW